MRDARCSSRVCTKSLRVEDPMRCLSMNLQKLRIRRERTQTDERISEPKQRLASGELEPPQLGAEEDRRDDKPAVSLPDLRGASRRQPCKGERVRDVLMLGLRMLHSPWLCESDIESDVSR
jgi:hypothetical protein